MNINVTLFGQMITFFIFVVITMKWIWPLFKKILDERAKKIADGLAAAEEGHRQLALAEAQIQNTIKEAKNTALKIIEEANHRAQVSIDRAKQEAAQAAEQVSTKAKAEIQQEVNRARETLKQEAAELSLLLAEKILKRKFEAKEREHFLTQTIAEL